MKTKKGLEKKYKSYVKVNKDGYSLAVIKSGEAVGKALDEGKTPAEADESMGDDLTGFQAGCVAQAIAHFHPKGEEYRKWWNKQYGVEDAKGIVNPAVVTIKSK